MLQASKGIKEIIISVNREILIASLLKRLGIMK